MELVLWSQWIGHQPGTTSVPRPNVFPSTSSTTGPKFLRLTTFTPHSITISSLLARWILGCYIRPSTALHYSSKHRLLEQSQTRRSTPFRGSTLFIRTPFCYHSTGSAPFCFQICSGCTAEDFIGAALPGKLSIAVALDTTDQEMLCIFAGRSMLLGIFTSHPYHRNCLTFPRSLIRILCVQFDLTGLRCCTTLRHHANYGSTF